MHQTYPVGIVLQVGSNPYNSRDQNMPKHMKKLFPFVRVIIEAVKYGKPQIQRSGLSVVEPYRIVFSLLKLLDALPKYIKATG